MSAPMIKHLSDRFDPHRSIFIKHYAKNVRDFFAEGEFRTATTPYELAKIIARERLEIPSSTITAIYEIIDDGIECTVTNITKDVFALAESGHFDRRDADGDAAQVGFDRERDRLSMARAL